jgi:hypothetical protein
MTSYDCLIEGLAALQIDYDDTLTTALSKKRKCDESFKDAESHELLLTSEMFDSQPNTTNRSISGKRKAVRNQSRAEFLTKRSP